MRAPPSHAPLLAKIIGRLLYFFRPDVEIRPLSRGVHVDWDVPIVLRDGTLLRANVFRPAETDSGLRVPVIMSAHPYNKDAIPAKSRTGRGISIQYRMLPQPSTVRFSGWTGWEAPDPAVWVPRGYAIVNGDLRGGGKAGGSDDLFSDQEAHDYYEAIEWASAQPWSSGRVGLLGVSYLAISQYRVAALRPPHLAAIFSDLLNQPRNAILATNFADGTTLLSPVWHEWRDGGFTIIVFDDDVKSRHIKRDPRVSVLVAGDEVPLRGVEVRARAQVVPTEPDLATLRRMAVRYVGPERGNAFIDTIDPATQQTLRVVPGVLRTWDFADEPSLAP